jgi:zinc/manganese transport system substrate-binding protein
MSLLGLRCGAAIAGVAVVGLAVAGCGSSADTSAAQPTPGGAASVAAIPVVASTDVYGSIAKAVGGDRLEVTSVINSPDADPHEYETTPADAVKVAQAKIVIMNGGGYDDFAARLVDATSAKPAVINAVDVSGLQAQVPAGEEFNEHVWYHLPTIKKVADQLAKDLGTVDSAESSTFASNAAAFNARIDTLIAKLDAVKAQHAGAKVAVTEPVPLYMTEAAGLQNATPAEFSEAIEEGTDPSAAVVNETLGLFSDKTVNLLLANSQTESPATRQVEQAATAAGIPVEGVTETLPVGVDDYVAWQSQQIDTLAKDLGNS